MIVLRVVGWLLILAALVLLGRDFYLWFASGHWAATLAGKLWHQLSPDTLDRLQAGIERHVWPRLWSDVIAPVLQQPAWLVLGVPGLVLAVIPRRGRKRRRFGR